MIYPKVFDKKVKIRKGNQKLDFHTESSEKIKCMVEGVASWLVQPNFTNSYVFCTLISTVSWQEPLFYWQGILDEKITYLEKDWWLVDSRFQSSPQVRIFFLKCWELTLFKSKVIFTKKIEYVWEKFWLEVPPAMYMSLDQKQENPLSSAVGGAS